MSLVAAGRTHAVRALLSARSDGENTLIFQSANSKKTSRVRCPAAPLRARLSPPPALACRPVESPFPRIRPELRSRARAGEANREPLPYSWSPPPHGILGLCAAMHACDPTNPSRDPTALVPKTRSVLAPRRAWRSFAPRSCPPRNSADGARTRCFAARASRFEPARGRSLMCHGGQSVRGRLRIWAKGRVRAER
jgi:hypothetical protein